VVVFGSPRRTLGSLELTSVGDVRPCRENGRGFLFILSPTFLKQNFFIFMKGTEREIQKDCFFTGGAEKPRWVKFPSPLSQKKQLCFGQVKLLQLSKTKRGKSVPFFYSSPLF
jgi:hypothetical protein